MENLLKQAFDSYDLPLNAAQTQQFLRYYEVLIDWNARVNLTAITEPQAVVDKHFLDSALVTLVLPELAGKRLIDVGTGAGFPGIPLKILAPELRLCLFDSLQKRINFLHTLCHELDIAGVDFVHGRAEDFGRQAAYRDSFDIVTARAVARLPVLLELCLPFVKPGGYFLALKGPELEQEIAESGKALRLLGGQLVAVKSFTLDKGGYTRNIAVIEKRQSTPKKYPRKAGTPQKQPLV